VIGRANPARPLTSTVTWQPQSQQFDSPHLNHLLSAAHDMLDSSLRRKVSFADIADEVRDWQMGLLQLWDDKAFAVLGSVPEGIYGDLDNYTMAGSFDILEQNYIGVHDDLIKIMSPQEADAEVARMIKHGADVFRRVLAVYGDSPYVA